jgi:DNA-binding IscR family transcriptional regulator
MEKLRIVGNVIIENSPNEFFSLDNIVEVSMVDRTSVRRILERLSREGLVIRISEKPGYLLLKNPMPWPDGKGRPPLAITYRVRSKEKLTQRVKPKQKENTAQDRMWSVIRNKTKVDGLFQVRDLVVLGEVKRENARWYLKQLRRAGIVKPSSRGGPGVTWTLIRDVGPRRPSINAECGFRNSE